MRRPLSLYIHIPFCKQKCFYCDFLSASVSMEQKESYVTALLQEMDFWKEEIKRNYEIKTIFIGGGTPTCLASSQLRQIGDKLDALWNIRAKKDLEFTIEANPGTITLGHIQAMKDIGINRVSLGLQSAQNRELKALGRIHTYEDFVESYQQLRNNGFDNINVDLMADIPEQTLESYQQTLEKVLSLAPEHLSSYSLIVEEGTPFYQLQTEGKLSIPDEETDRKMYELTQQMLSDRGYRRYEISNYAKTNKECRHNLTYWRMGEYLGIGLGASSYFKGYRFSNTRQMEQYIHLPSEKHYNPLKEDTFWNTEDCYRLSRKEEMEEFVFLGLRTMQGISLLEYKERFGVDFHDKYQNVLEPLLQKSLLAESGNRDRIYLTNRGIDVSNMVLAEFLL